jgi:uncharacterized membrane protein YecN with MAPEG domain
MLIPITAFYAGLLGAFYLYLSAVVSANRRREKVSLGDGETRHFQQIIRSHGNFSEYVPLVLILMLVAELNGGHFWLLQISGNAILFGRLLHAYGLRHHYGASWQRLWGAGLTYVSIAILSAANLLTLYSN